MPGLGLRRGLADDLVVAPYAIGAGRPARSRGGREQPAAPGGPGLEGEYGDFDAIDFTQRGDGQSRGPPGPARACVVVRPTWPITRA